MVLAFLFAVGVMGVQVVGLALTSAKVNHAAQEAAYVAGSSIEPATDRTPCWAVSGGLSHPEGYADSNVCKTVVENLGNLKTSNVTLAVTPSMIQRTNHTPVHVTLTYNEPVTSPLLKLFMGDTFTSTADASSWID